MRAAVSKARATSRRSVAIREGSSLRRRKALIPRCAWCGRYALGPNFYDEDDVPLFLHWQNSLYVTHSICPDCVERLKRDGLSR